MPVQQVAIALAATAAAIITLRRQDRRQPAKQDTYDVGASAPQPMPAVAWNSAIQGPVANECNKQTAEAERHRRIALASSVVAVILVALSFVMCLIRGALDVAAALAVAWTLVLLEQASSTAGNWLWASRSSKEAGLPKKSEKQDPAKLPQISGTWIKDPGMSDSMEEAMSLMHLNGLIRTAAKLINGMRIELNESTFHLTVLSVIGWFKVVETYSMDGAASATKRRDKRRGKAQGVLCLTPHGTLLLKKEWGDPFAGTASDEFELGKDGFLRVTTTMHVGDRSCRYTQVYRPKAQ